MSSHAESGGGGGIIAPIEEHVVETVQAGFGGLADATYRNIWDRLKDTKNGISEALGGFIVEPLKGLGKGAEELSHLHLGRAVLSIVAGVRNGIMRVLKGVVNFGENVVVGGTDKLLTGLLTSAGGVALMGDMRNVIGGGGEVAHAH